jgi:Mrp family chromosome partitioning ATPase
VLGAGDANVLEEVSDGVILVARASLTRGADLGKAAEQLGPRRILGVVLNDVTPRPVARKNLSAAASRAI